jgi:hypothetical protein
MFGIDQVFGTWYVPKILFTETNQTTRSSFWIGIDGDPIDDPFCALSQTCDLVQEGTEQRMTNICAFTCFTFGTYYAWSEFLPQQGVEQVIGGLHVNPGDEIYSTLGMCNIGSNGFCFSANNGLWASFVMEDITRGEYTQFYTPRVFSVAGSEAEWIMERPQVGNSFADLADYGLATMTGAYACNTGFPDAANCMNYNSPKSGFTSERITMTNGAGNVLSFVEPTSSTEMIFFWSQFH